MNRLNKIKGVNKKRFQSIKLILLTLVLLFSNLSLSQNNIERYTIGEIEVSGNTSFSPITIVTFSGLREGDAISIPGEKLSNAIKKLWGSSKPKTLKTNLGKYLLTRLLRESDRAFAEAQSLAKQLCPNCKKDFCNYEDNYSDKLH